MVVLNRLIGDGKDMKRILSFKYDDNFCVYENDSLLFTIDRKQLKLDSKLIYEKLFKGLKENPEIKIDNNVNPTGDKVLDNLSSFIYTTISTLIDDICVEIQSKNIFNEENS